jgi:hypothetical protein
MKDILFSALKLLWTRDSEDAACLAIVTAQWMDAKDLRQLADYYRALAKDVEIRGK